MKIRFRNSQTRQLKCLKKKEFIYKFWRDIYQFSNSIFFVVMFKAALIVILLLTLALLIPTHSFKVVLNVQNKRLNMSRSGKSGGGWNRRAGKGNGLKNSKGQRKELDSCADNQHVIPFKSKWPSRYINQSKSFHLNEFTLHHHSPVCITAHPKFR